MELSRNTNDSFMICLTLAHRMLYVCFSFHSPFPNTLYWWAQWFISDAINISLHLLPIQLSGEWVEEWQHCSALFRILSVSPFSLWSSFRSLSPSLFPFSKALPALSKERVNSKNGKERFQFVYWQKCSEWFVQKLPWSMAIGLYGDGESYKCTIVARWQYTRLPKLNYLHEGVFTVECNEHMHTATQAIHFNQDFPKQICTQTNTNTSIHYNLHIKT